MQKPLGQYLDTPDQFFWFINNQLVLFTLFRFLRATNLFAYIEEGGTSMAELSEHTGIDADNLKRLCYFMAAEELLDLKPDGLVVANVRTRYMKSILDVLGTGVHALDAGSTLAEGLRQGVSPYEVRFGKPVFEHLADQPETAQMFNGLMSFMTGLIEEFVFSQHQFEPFQVAVDVGGNHGGLLLSLLGHYPQASGILFDLPEVIEMVGPTVQAHEQGSRVELASGSFFESVPEADLYLIKMILHDWSDEECHKILGTIRKAIRPEGRIAVIDYVLPETPRQHPANSMDIEMMVWANGKERKLSQFKDLFEQAGFNFERLTDNPYGQCVVEAVPV